MSAIGRAGRGATLRSIGAASCTALVGGAGRCCGVLTLRTGEFGLLLGYAGGVGPSSTLISGCLQRARLLRNDGCSVDCVLRGTVELLNLLLHTGSGLPCAALCAGHDGGGIDALCCDVHSERQRIHSGGRHGGACRYSTAGHSRVVPGGVALRNASIVGSSSLCQVKAALHSFDTVTGWRSANHAFARGQEYGHHDGCTEITETLLVLHRGGGLTGHV